jgi:uncharacterized protein YndB with AHSA1/START domain
MNPHTFEPGPLVDVDAHPNEDRWTLVFVRELRHPPEKVWAALTDPAQLREWSPFVADRDLGHTGDAVLTMIDGDTSEDLPGVVRRAEPVTILEYTWGTDVLRWELAATDSGTRLTLRHTMDDRDGLPKVAAGWHLCLVVAERLLDGRPIGPIRGESARSYGWDELNEGYAAKLGIDGAAADSRTAAEDGR